MADTFRTSAGQTIHAAAIGAPALLPLPPDDTRPNKGKVGMLAFLLSEVAFFGTLVATYVAYIPEIKQGKPVGLNGELSPLPSQVFYMPLVLLSTVCLFSSSATVHFATKALHKGSLSGFRGWWAATILLGALFLGGTALEWRDLIFTWGVTPARSMFGTTYFTVVGFHAFHVSIGVLLMTLVLILSKGGLPLTRQPLDAELVSWYWHFVDGVWVVVFSVVYLIGR